MVPAFQPEFVGSQVNGRSRNRHCSCPCLPWSRSVFTRLPAVWTSRDRHSGHLAFIELLNWAPMFWSPSNCFLSLANYSATTKVVFDPPPSVVSKKHCIAGCVLFCHFAECLTQANRVGQPTRGGFHRGRR